MAPKEQARRSIYNYPMQHGASQIVNRAMVALDSWKADLVLQMHDELMLEVPVGNRDYWDHVMKGIMEAPVPELGGMVFPTKGGRGYNWGDVEH